MKRYGGLPGGRELQQAVAQTMAVLERLVPAAGSSGVTDLVRLADGNAGNGTALSTGITLYLREIIVHCIVLSSFFSVERISTCVQWDADCAQLFAELPMWLCPRHCRCL